MRRAHAQTTSAFTPSQTLPTKQKGFKPPLARAAPPAQPRLPPVPRTAPRAAPAAALPTPELTPTSAGAPQRTKYGDGGSGAQAAGSRSSSPAPAEADSSYGELPFDIDALEEEMRKYD